MIKFKNKIDGSVFYAEPNSIQFRVLKSNKDFEEVKEKKEEKSKKKATK